MRRESCWWKHNYDEVGDVWGWGSGEAFDSDEIQSIPETIHFTVESFRGYQGAPVEIRDTGVCLMSRRLSEVLIQAGVDNIDFYPVVLTNTETAQTFDYLTYNLIGKVKAANMKKSDYTGYDNELLSDVGFKKLVLDGDKLNELLIFRLAENLGTVLIHESVRKYILEQGIDTLTFVKPEEYICV